MIIIVIVMVFVIAALVAGKCRYHNVPLKVYMVSYLRHKTSTAMFDTIYFDQYHHNVPITTSYEGIIMELITDDVVFKVMSIFSSSVAPVIPRASRR